MSPTPTTGVIYVATGPDYRDLAQASARSLRHHEPQLAIDLFTDAPDTIASGLFDAVHPIEEPHDRSKLDCMAFTRFERTLFLDCDTLVVNRLGDLFDLLDRFDLAAAHDVRRTSDLIRQGQRHATPYAFPQLNSGVLLYRMTQATRAFLSEWRARYTAGRDQPIFKDLLWETDIRFYVLPPEFNLRRVTMLDAWEPLDATPTILHSHRFMDHMRSDYATAGGTRITDVVALMDAERAALQAEWEAAGGRPDHPIARFSSGGPASDD
ncbi:putative nucleotide-diphospho-sugar transferase [uncultured Maritimibacter sp.]|jgi:hypothetical protein|uniref:putative nucleotide-diphospho-sugar transferase n=1 Tax=uncultured Maritimibacter sp. TaxID=991866 RepID=UPI00261ABC8D|nr:putative nucleotide-diphospho-sugar transferase [uncultured Maritimibacter sp.]